MLYVINVSEGIGANKINAFKECVVCGYWYFLNKGFVFNHLFVMTTMMY